MSAPTITRRKIMRSRFATGYGPAWKWIYDVMHDGKALVLGTDRLSTARDFARKASKDKPVQAWCDACDRNGGECAVHNLD